MRLKLNSANRLTHIKRTFQENSDCQFFLCEFPPSILFIISFKNDILTLEHEVFYAFIVPHLL